MKKQRVTLRWKRGNGCGWASSRGWDLHWGPNRLAYVRLGQGGWYFVARHDALGVPLENTAGRPVDDSASARQEASEYVLKHLRVARPSCDLKTHAKIPGGQPSEVA